MFFILRPILYDDPDMVGHVGVYDTGSYQGRRVQSDPWTIGRMTRTCLEPKDSWTIFIFHKY